jgi:hypothetical protein
MAVTGGRMALFSLIVYVLVYVVIYAFGLTYIYQLLRKVLKNHQQRLLARQSRNLGSERFQRFPGVTESDPSRSSNVQLSPVSRRLAGFCLID